MLDMHGLVMHIASVQMLQKWYQGTVRAFPSLLSNFNLI